MYKAEYTGVNAFLRDTCRLILREGVRRETIGKVCYELPEPYLFKITDPTARLVTIPVRKWYAPLAYGESLWLASGRNDMDFINRYSRNMKNFSDNGLTMRGGYGPRFRHFNGSSADYDVRTVEKEAFTEVDQFRYVVDCFHKDTNTRQAIVNIGDPVKDCFGEDRLLKVTKDIPCTRTLHFMKDVKSDNLNLIVTMRSNDLIWGASAVNIFNFTFMQEYFAAILGLGIGNYYHMADNLHYYEDFRPMVEAIAAIDDIEDLHYKYCKSFHSLQDFDMLVKKLSDEEQKMRSQGDRYQYKTFGDDFFQDWYNVLYHTITKREVEFINPELKKYYATRLANRT